jgi:adenosylmethionine-8-amino-7-oxononanoate aminotransferase
MTPARTPASSHLWLHLTPLTGQPLHLVRGEGSHVFDVNGNQYVDALAGNFCVQVGYGRKELADVAIEQMRKLPFCRNVNITTDATLMLADELARVSGMSRVFLSSGGSEAVETAMKLARQYFYLKGEARRTKFIAREMAYHGSTLGALSLNGVPSLRAPFEPLIPGIVRVPMPAFHESDTSELSDAGWIRRAIESEGPDTVAGVFIEPVQVTGGPLLPPEGYFREVRSICDEYGILLVSDEVVNAFGRLGGMFAYQVFDFRPDIVTLAKGLTSGYMPAGATLVAAHVCEPFDSGDDYFRHILTYGGHPVACAVALENIRILTEEGLDRIANQSGEQFLGGLREKLANAPLLGSIRGMGLLVGLELVQDADSHTPVSSETAQSVAIELLKHGVITRVDTRGHPIIQLAPPLSSTNDDMSEIMNGVEAALQATAQSR